MVFFLDTDGTTRVGMDSTTTVSVSMPSTASSSSTMSGKSVSDEVIEGNLTLSLTGFVTYAKLPSQETNLNPINFQRAIQRARRLKRRFTVYYKDTGQALMESYKDCVITSFDFTIDKYSDTITVSMSFEQIFVSQAAKVGFLAAKIPKKVKESDKPTVDNITSNGQSTSTEETDDNGATYFSSITGGVSLKDLLTTPTP